MYPSPLQKKKKKKIKITKLSEILTQQSSRETLTTPHSLVGSLSSKIHFEVPTNDAINPLYPVSCHLPSMRAWAWHGMAWHKPPKKKNTPRNCHTAPTLCHYIVHTGRIVSNMQCFKHTPFPPYPLPHTKGSRSVFCFFFLCPSPVCIGLFLTCLGALDEYCTGRAGEM